jgi:hypothetical protein
MWTDRWRGGDARLAAVAERLRAEQALVWHGGDYDRWDLEVRGGLIGSARLLMGVEEQGGGCQMVRACVWPRVSRPAWITGAALIALSVVAWLDHAPGAAAILAALGAALALRAAWEAGRAQGALVATLQHDLTPDR